MKRFPLEVSQRVKYMGLVLLNEIINFQHYFPISLRGNDEYLRPYLDSLVSGGLLKMQGGQFIPTDLGREQLDVFYKKYYEYIQMLDIFCAVDLEAGEFAFSRMNDDSLTDEDWVNHLNEERFSDVRVAVAELKNIDPNEIVFMSFLHEGRFELDQPDWQNTLTNEESSIWNEIEEITNSAISLEYLLENDVIQDVVKQGTQIAMDLIRQADELNADEEFIDDEYEEVIETVEYVDVVELPVYDYDYWDPYYDPYYVSPIWLVPLFLW